ncbi:hypothetical protein BOTBODRAFT_240585 [Botryobasidium botryosum FD-172 SS1]|uniref:Uncharacterized protein n=1 Tax=Botryobasidium botryosum (strain FD-172 SS1) TaxID=930990 RepID=A0A067MQ17_BOTB1|nr:hypothetical protein BOTBODRAFT_240585 [Botryobasidium botryosum FD-172 SS1]
MPTSTRGTAKSGSDISHHTLRPRNACRTTSRACVPFASLTQMDASPRRQFATVRGGITERNEASLDEQRRRCPSLAAWQVLGCGESSVSNIARAPRGFCERVLPTLKTYIRPPSRAFSTCQHPVPLYLPILAGPRAACSLYRSPPLSDSLL